MSYTLDFYPKKVIATFKNTVELLEISKAFFEVIETVSIINLNNLVFNLTDITSYTIPDNYIERLKLNTQFSTSWNANITVVFVTTNSEIKHMVTGFMNHSQSNDDVQWQYHLFKDMESARKKFNKI